MSSSTTFTPVDIIYPGLVYSAEFKTIICSYCRYGLGDINSTLNYLLNLHLDIFNKDEVNNIIKPKLINLTLVNIKDITLPPPYTTYFKDLIEAKGFQCLKCLYITKAYKALRQHLNEKHNIKSNKTFKNNNFKDFYVDNISIQ